MAGGLTSDDLRLRGAQDYICGAKVTQCPFPNGKQRHAWVAGWYAARAEQGAA